MRIYLPIVVFISIAFYSCVSTRFLQPHEKLLVSNKIKGIPSRIEGDEVYALVKQKPNRKILFFRFHLWVHNLFDPQKVESSLLRKQEKIERKNRKRLARGKRLIEEGPQTFRNWIANVIGEPPVVLDTLLCASTAANIRAFLKNKGYFYSQVTYSVEPVPKRVPFDEARKAKVQYVIQPGPLFMIDSIGLRVTNRQLAKIIISEGLGFFNLRNKPFDLDVIDKEREKFANTMRNNGYYYLSKEHIFFEADTTRKKGRLDLYVNVKDLREKVLSPLSGRDTVLLIPHAPCYIGKIYVKQQYDPAQPEKLFPDTIYEKGIYFIENPPALLRHGVIAFQILFKEGEIYQEKKHLLTYSRLNAMKTFSHVSIKFKERPENKNVLDCFIMLSLAPVHSFNLEAEGYNSGGFLGTSGNFSYQNRNLMRGAEILNIKMKGGIEAQPLILSNHGEGEIIQNLPFNTFELSPEMSLEVPRFLIPVRMERFAQKSSPKTQFNLSYNYQQRPDYDRTMLKGFCSYSWHESEYKKHIVTPFELSLLKLNPQPTFAALLDTTQDIFIINAFKDQLIPALKYTFLYNTQSKPKMIDFWYIKADVETAGNILQLYSNIEQLPVDELGSHKIFGIRYSQYVRTSLDIRYYFKYPKTTYAYRFYAGIGVPYGNAVSLPFERNFFAGGSNGIRAWQIRTLGPGSMPDSLITSPLNRMGNIHLEGSAEARITITSLIKGAFFVDVGNVWMLKKEESRPYAEFNISRLWRDLAIGSGIGIRLDFGFFLIRFDFGIPFKQPNSKYPYRIRPDIRKTPLSLGIGYPF